MKQKCGLLGARDRLINAMIPVDFGWMIEKYSEEHLIELAVFRIKRIQEQIDELKEEMK